MVMQMELQEWVTVKCEMEKLDAVLAALKDRFAQAARDNEEVEQGSLSLKVTQVAKDSTSWAKVYERIVELHPELAGAMKGIEVKFTKKVEYPLVAVLPAAV